MRLLSKILWLLAFLAATFVWMVLFEHGFSVKGLTEGAREEWREMSTTVKARFRSATNETPPETEPDAVREGDPP